MSFNISISVHDLVDFVLRSGDIDTRIFNNATMLEGTRIHRYYQAKMDKDYKSEVFLSFNCEYDEFTVHIEGRADGIIDRGDTVIIDEIKTCVGNIETFHKKNENWHLGQAKVYAFLYCINNYVHNADIVLTYISQEDQNDIEKYFYSYKFDELETFFYELLNEYLSFQRLLINHKINVREKCHSLKFPYENLNKNQDKLMIFVNEVEEEKGNRALIEAPTGIGKTISLLYPSLLNLNKYDRIFYLTAKNSGKEILDSTFGNELQNDIGLKSVILTAKDKICPMKDVICNPENCPFAKDYYDKIHKVLIEAYFSKKPHYNYEFFKEMEEKYQICPFEFQLDLSLFCDVVIGDYNYIFDPFVYLQRYLDKDVSKSLLLVDEGHNLLDRCRKMYSSSFSVSDIDKTKKSLRSLKNPTVKNNLNKLKKYMQEFNDYVDNNGIFALDMFDESFLKILSKMVENYTSLSTKDSKLITKEYKKLFQEINKFLKLLEITSNELGFKYFYKKIGDNIEANIYCTSPTKFINELTNRFKNTLVFSATLTPFKYYNELLFKGDNNTLMQDFDSPFDTSRLNLNIVNNLSIKYKDRLSTIDDVVSKIVAFISVKKGNYFVFAPSFEYLNLLKEKLNIENVELIYQEKEMNEKDRKTFINKFKNDSDVSKVGICVLGGSFSESINLVGDYLIGVVIIGVGMPSICYENNIIKDYYNSIGLDGFYYSYIIPGMKNVIQGVGRLIRTENDYGSVLLIDERYKQSNYRNLFRKEWKNAQIVKNDYEIIENLNIFYKKILDK